MRDKFYFCFVRGARFLSDGHSEPPGEKWEQAMPLHQLKAITGTRIRPCNDGDVAAVCAIYGHHVLHGRGSFELDPPDEAEMARRFADLRDRGMPCLVAEQDGEVVGYAYAAAFRPRPAYRHTVEDTVYVRADRAHRGIGRALLSALIEECIRLGFRQMIAVIGDSANDGSVRLHAALGFHPAGVLRGIGFKHGRWLDVVQMQRPLGDGDGALPTAAAG